MRAIAEIIAAICAALLAPWDLACRYLPVAAIGSRIRRKRLQRRIHRTDARMSFGAGVSVGRDVTVKVGANATLIVGSGVVLGDGCYVNVFPGAKLTIEDGAHINRCARVSAFTEVSIGANSVLAAFSTIHDHHHKYDLMSPWQKDGYEGAPVCVGTGVMILARTGVTEGVTIGDHSVIGANSVVTRDIPEGALAAGVPAKVLRTAPSSTATMALRGGTP